MSRLTEILTQEQFQEKINQARNQQDRKQQQLTILFPSKNIQQTTKIGGKDGIHEYNKINIQGIPDNIQFTIDNKDLINVNNSYLSFKLHFKLENLPNTNGQNFSAYYINTKDIISSNNINYIYQIVLIDNFICLIVSTFPKQSNNLNQSGLKGVYGSGKNNIVWAKKLYQIPVNPGCYLDNCVLQKTNKTGNFNNYYYGIYRKQSIANQTLKQQYVQYNQQMYANTNYTKKGQLYFNVLYQDEEETQAVIQLINNLSFRNTKQTYQILAQKSIDIPINELKQETGQDDQIFEYYYQVNIPLKYFHPLFQEADYFPAEILNDKLHMTFNFNKPIFSSCYKSRYSDTNKQYLRHVQTRILDISNMKLNLYTEQINDKQLFMKTINQNLYLTYTDSSLPQVFTNKKYNQIQLQNLIPKLASLNLIQINLIDKKQIGINEPENPDKYTLQQYDNYEEYLGYSSLFKENGYLSDDRFGDILQGLYIGNSACEDIQMTSFGDIQMTINDKNILPYSYQELQDNYQLLSSIYNIHGTYNTPNSQWQYPDYLRYFNTFIYRFDNYTSQQKELLQSSFNGLETNGGKSVISFNLYNYNGQQQSPRQIQYDQYLISDENLKLGNNKYWNMWINQNLYIEFISYYTGVFQIKDGDITALSQDEIIDMIHPIKAKVEQIVQDKEIQDQVKQETKELFKDPKQQSKIQESEQMAQQATQSTQQATIKPQDLVKI